MRISDWSSDVCSSDLALAGGGEWTNPQIDIAATTEQEDINATIAITGSAQDPHIAFTSTPALPQDEVLSRLLFGSSPENLSATEAIQLAAALNSLRGGGGGLNPLGTLRRSEEHTSELQSLMRISYDGFCLKKKHNLQA